MSLRFFLPFLVLLFSGFSEAPPPPSVIDDFQPERFLGTWHEIARTENTFQRNLDRVSATYSVSGDGFITVINRAYDLKVMRWRTTKGRAMLAGERNVGSLKVSFLGTFYSRYNILDIDRKNYSWALVCGRDRSLFWIISRHPTMDKTLLKRLLAEARKLGFDTAHVLYAGYGGKLPPGR